MFPKVSVIVPVYGVEKYLPECIESILAQTFADFELLLIDDGSPDNSGKICDEYAAKDSRVKVFHKENGGVSSARNYGLKNASGTYVAWVDPDDWVAPNYLQDFVEEAERGDFDIVACGYKRCYEKNGIQMPIPGVVCEAAGTLKQRMLCSPNYLWTQFYKRNLWQDIFFKEGIINEDMGVMPSLVIRAKSVTSIDTFPYHYRIRSGSLTAKSDDRVLNALVAIDCVLERGVTGFEREVEYVAIRECIPRYVYISALKNSHALQKKIRDFLYSRFPNWEKNEIMPKLANFQFNIYKFLFIRNLWFLTRSIERLKSVIRRLCSLARKMGFRF